MIKIAVTAAALAAMVAGSAWAADPKPDQGWTPDEDIIGHLTKSKHHHSFMKALEAAGMIETLKGKGPFTVMAPTDQAFSELPHGMLDQLLKPENAAALKKIVGCHVIAGKIELGIPVAAKKRVVETVGGCKLTVAPGGDSWTVADENGIVAKTLMFDVFEANGEIEVLDAVLTPKT